MALHIALVGAESTGKSQLGVALLTHLSAQTRLRCALIPEYLREWCERELRTPRPDEQRAIAAHLDHETARIDHVILSAERSIGLLAEYRTALITEVVTGKVDLLGETHG